MSKLWSTVNKHKKGLLLGLAAILAIPAGIYWQSAGTKATSAPVQTVTVERGDVLSVVAATGSIQPLNSVDISSKITAQIKEVKVKENDEVKAGQVLVILEDDDLRPQLVQAQERVANAAANLERNQRLNQIGAVPDQQLDALRMEYKIAQASYEQILSKVNETVIKSPIDGIVIGKPLPAGEMVAQGVSNPTVIMTVADMSKMQIEAQVDQTDIGKIAVGQKVIFTVDAYPDKKFHGVVANISKKAVTQQNVIYYTTTIDVSDAGDLLNPDMVARVSIIVGEAKNVLTLPLSAIRSDKNGKYVAVMKPNGQTENVPIVTGITGDDRVEIKSGVTEGDTIVVSQPKTQGQAAGGQSSGQRPGGNPVNNMMRRL
ncbi:MAG: efflux RND transporter periplasmic adaptor subunit [Negativicutes bacterium]|nr:efflux RND transporter periplasmic adaptor subunit [Negativicutes bacterium]